MRCSPVLALVLAFPRILLLQPRVLLVNALAFSTSRSKLPPPPCPKSNPADDIFRNIRRKWPVPLQHWLTTSGVQRFLQDTLLIVGLPVFIKKNPNLFWDFFHLTTSSIFMSASSDRPRSCMTKLSYGVHKLQFMDLIEPKTTSKADGVVVFVHGGGWGSGKAWMYRLCALPFLEQNKAVAILNYRTYPSADVNGQALDVKKAIHTLVQKRSDLLDEEGRIESLLGHSSGAHIALLYVLDSAKNSMQQMGTSTSPIKKYIGLSGVYCVPTHYQYEIGRGVEQLSALRVACGPEEKFHEASAVFRLECIAQPDGDGEQCIIVDDDGKLVGPFLDEHVPDFLFVHGTDDNVVDYNQSLNMVDSIRAALIDPNRCEECILENVGHADTVIHLMLGGVTRDVVKSQLEQKE